MKKRSDKVCDMFRILKTLILPMKMMSLRNSLGWNAQSQRWTMMQSFFCLVLYFWIVIVIVIDCFCILIIEHLRTLRLSWSFDFRLNLLRPERSHPRWTRWKWASSRLKRRKRTFLRKRWEVSRLILPISSWSVPSCYLLSISSFLFFSSIYLSLKKKRAKSPRR